MFSTFFSWGFFFNASFCLLALDGCVRRPSVVHARLFVHWEDPAVTQEQLFEYFSDIPGNYRVLTPSHRDCSVFVHQCHRVLWNHALGVESVTIKYDHVTKESRCK